MMGRQPSDRGLSSSRLSAYLKSSHTHPEAWRGEPFVTRPPELLSPWSRVSHAPSGGLVLPCSCLCGLTAVGGMGCTLSHPRQVPQGHPLPMALPGPQEARRPPPVSPLRAQRVLEALSSLLQRWAPDNGEPRGGHRGTW